MKIATIQYRLVRIKIIIIIIIIIIMIIIHTLTYENYEDCCYLLQAS